MNFNISIVIGLSSTLLAQLIKVIVILVTDKKFAGDRMFSTGGMPSSHSAGLVSVATSIGIIDGWNSTTFGIATALALVVMYDATGVRRAAGVHAEYLNVIVEELSHIFKKDGEEQKALKTLLGHTYIQVIAGFLLGIICAYFTHYVIL
ncbi:MAG: divergent PAP2 family protein [Spirochaetaceae bacterium]